MVVNKKNTAPDLSALLDLLRGDGKVIRLLKEGVKCALSYKGVVKPHYSFLVTLNSNWSISLLRAGRLFYYPCSPICKWWLNKKLLSIKHLPHVCWGQNTSRSAKRMKARKCLGPDSHLPPSWSILSVDHFSNMMVCRVITVLDQKEAGGLVPNPGSATGCVTLERSLCSLNLCFLIWLSWVSKELPKNALKVGTRLWLLLHPHVPGIG